MDEQIMCRISKAGKNLFARIPDEDRYKISRGALVQITVLEKQINDPDKVKAELKQFMDAPLGGEKLKGTIMGYPIEIPLSKLVADLPKNKLEKILLEALNGNS